MEWFQYIRKILTVICLTSISAYLCAKDNDKDYKYVQDNRILNDKQYYYWEKGGCVFLQIVMPENGQSVFESLIRIESPNNESYNLVMYSSIQSGLELFWIHNSDIERRIIITEKEQIPDTLSLSLSFIFPADSVQLNILNRHYTFPSQDMRPDHSYRFVPLGNSYSHLTLVKAQAWRNITETDTRDISPWYWISLVLLIDALIFLYMHNRRKRQKKLEQETRKNKSLSDKKVTVHLPQHNAVYLFGGLQIFDKNGEEISLRFSPLLRELFLLLLFRSQEGGISTEELTDILWFDKDKTSAKNNRAVNLHKLRTLLSSVENCQVKKIGKNWHIQFGENTFVDYYECMPEKMLPDKLNPDRIKIIAAMTMRGFLLNECDYLWLDIYKSRITDVVINALLKYISLLGEHEAFETKLQVCDIIFHFDSVNEAALKLKCTTYVIMNRLYMAKNTYEHFCREYQDLYDEPYTQSFSSIISM